MQITEPIVSSSSSSTTALITSSDGAYLRQALYPHCMPRKPGMFDSNHTHLLTGFRAHADILRPATIAAAKQLLSSTTPTAVLIADAGIVRLKYAQIRTQLVQYAKSGVTVILGCLFLSMVRPLDFALFMDQSWKLPWKFKAYQREVVSRNSAAFVAWIRDSADMPKSYSQKAIFLQGIAPGTAVYKSSDRSTQAPVAFSPVAQGFLGFIGDVIGEEEFTAVILAMCNLQAWKRNDHSGTLACMVKLPP